MGLEPLPPGVGSAGTALWAKNPKRQLAILGSPPSCPGQTEGDLSRCDKGGLGGGLT